MKKFNHPYIVNLIDTVQSSSSIYFFMEFCNGGDLRGYLKSKQGGFLSEQEAVALMNDFLKAMKYLVSQNCLHRDIKPENILIHNGRLKLADFGFSKIVDNLDKERQNTLLGSPLYAAPQILEGGKYSSKCDVFSTGLIFYEILYGDHPYMKGGIKAATIPQLAKAVREVKLILPDKPKRNEKLKELLIKMLEKEEAARYSWEQVFENFDRFKTEYYQELSDISGGKDLDEFGKSLSEFIGYTKNDTEEHQEDSDKKLKKNLSNDGEPAGKDNEKDNTEEALNKVKENVQKANAEREAVRLNEYVKFERNKAYILNEAITHLAKTYISKKFTPLTYHIYYRIVCCAIKLFIKRLEQIEGLFKIYQNENSWKYYFSTKMFEETQQKLKLDITKLRKTFDQFYSSTMKELGKITEGSKDAALIAEIGDFKKNILEPSNKLEGLEKIFLNLLKYLIKLAQAEFEKADKDYLMSLRYLNIAKNLEKYFKWPENKKDPIPDFKRFYETTNDMDKKELLETILKEV